MPRPLSCSLNAVENIMTSCFTRLWPKRSGVCRRLLVCWWRAKETDARKGKRWMSVVFGSWFVLSSAMDAGTMLNGTKTYDSEIILLKASSHFFYSACISNAARCFRGNGNIVPFPLVKLETVSDFYILLCIILPCNWALALHSFR